MKHQGADQDVDTDLENVQSSKSSLLSDLKASITKYQNDIEGTFVINNVY
jgi:hypothetical protein